MKKVIASALLAAAVASSAFAASSGDIILGFRATGGTGASSNLEIDLGNFDALPSGGGTVVLTNIDSDLNNTYGSDWATRSDVLWGAAGSTLLGATGNTEPSRTLVGTVLAPSSLLDGTSTTTPYNSAAAATQGGVATKINAIYNTFTGTANNVVSSSSTTSWTTEVGTTPAAFNFFFKTSFDNNLDLATTSASGTYSAGDLYELVPASGAGAFLGTLAVQSNGDVTFSTFSAVPESSTYAVILGSCVLGFVALRRRKQVVA